MPVTIAGLGTLSDDEYFAVAPKNDYDLILELPNGGRLYMGETPNDECLWMNQTLRLVDVADRAPSRLVTTDNFDVRVDLYGHNLRAAEGVIEHLIPLGDSDIRKWTTDELLDLGDAVFFTFAALADGQRVLVNCQAGLNRSGLVTALALIAYGLDAEAAVNLIRTRRAELCLANGTFVDFLHRSGQRFAKQAVDGDTD